MVELESGRTNALQNPRPTGLEESGHNPDKMLREFPRELLEKAAPKDWVKAMKVAMKVMPPGFPLAEWLKNTRKVYSKGCVEKFKNAAL